MEISSKVLRTNASQNTIMGVKFSSTKKYRAALYAILSNMIEDWLPSIEDVKLVRQQTDKIFKKYEE